jgi:transcriptional regulator with XRE-family HTH domain
MAENLIVSLSTYQRIESGETNSWALHLEDISKTLGVSIEEIILDKEKYIQIVKEQSTGYNGEIIINNLSEKVIELYEKRLEDKDFIIQSQAKRINELEKLLNL